MGIEPLLDKWRAFGWEVHEVDGHDVERFCRLLRGLAETARQGHAGVVIAHTVKGKGISLHGDASPAGISAISRRTMRRAPCAELRGEA